MSTAQHNSIRLLVSSLEGRGFLSDKITINGHSHRRFTKADQLWITPTKYVRYPFVSQSLLLLSLNKNLAYDYIDSVGYSVPRTVFLPVATEFVGEQIALRWPLITKPVDGSGSANVTRGITNGTTLKAAVQKLHDAGYDALVQEQFIGEEIRLTVIDGEVASACVRQVAQVVGTGDAAVSRLVTIENQSRAELQFEYIAYPQLDSTLMTLQVDMNSVPRNGEKVLLAESTLISGGASVYSIDTTLHESYRAMAGDLARKLRAPFLVVDILTRDYSQTATPDSYVILEFNTSPALKLYYGFRDGKQYDIIPKLTSMIEAAM